MVLRAPQSPQRYSTPRKTGGAAAAAAAAAAAGAAEFMVAAGITVPTETKFVLRIVVLVRVQK